MIFFFILLFIGLVLLFVPDSNKSRRIAFNIFQGSVLLIFAFPLLMAYISAPAGESMWNENTGGGAWLWLYFLIAPATVIAQVILLIVKLVFMARDERQRNDLQNKNGK